MDSCATTVRGLLWLALVGAAVAPARLLAAGPHVVRSPALPIRFEPSGASGFRSQGGRQTLLLTAGAASILGPAGAVSMTFSGSSSVPPVPDDSQPSVSNYYLGSDPAKWRTDVPAYTRVRYPGLYPGIDLVFYGNTGRLEYDFLVTPGADAARIRIELKGADRLTLTGQGDLTLSASGEQIAFRKPRVYQDFPGGRCSIPARYRLSQGVVSFAIGDYDRSLPLVIDPVLEYATFYGGSGGETAYAVASDSSGSLYIAGSTSSANLPTTAGAVSAQSPGGSSDAFVAKFGPSGTLIYATYLGGSGADQAYGLAVDSQGDAYITGSATSTNFPVTQGAYQTGLEGASNVFVAKLNPTGAALIYSSYLGGSGSDTGYGIAVDGSGDAFIAGSTSSANFPVSAAAYRLTYSGGTSEAFVTAFNPSGAGLLYSTYLGGSTQDQAYAIALDAKGDAYVAGATLSADFPNTPGIIQAAENGSYDAFISVLNPTGTALLYSTLLGGSADDYACGIAVDSSGNAYVTGYTGSTNFPSTPGVLQLASAGGYDAFITKINSSGTALVYSTYLGGSGDDYALPIAVDPGGNAYITGDTTSTAFPVTAGALQSSAPGSYTAFVTVLNSDASSLWYSTYLGGSMSQTGWGIALSPTEEFIAAGYTASPDFPVTASAFQSALAGPTNAFVTRFSALSLPMLTIAIAQTGNFTSGESGAEYSLTVSNSAAAGPTSGAVTVTESLPAGLALVSMSGAGWTCVAGGNSCTRNDSLSAGSSYPSITVQVNVSQNAAGQLTNQVSAAGGGSPAAGAQDITSVSLPAQTITFGSLPNQAYGSGPVLLSATASSGLAVSFNSQTALVCSVSGSTVTLVNVGTCTIQATQSGTTNWAAATPVNQSFQVTQGSQTISFGRLQNQAFGTSPFTASATASSGQPVSFNSQTTTGVCTVSGSTVTLVNVGTCTIQATQAGNANWSAATPANESFQVTQGSQTISFSPLQNQAYGTSPFTVSATAGSGQPVSFNSQTTTGVCTVSGSTVTLVVVGTCTIQATQSGNANWSAATPVNQSFQVTQGSQTIAFPTIPSQALGTAPLTLTATASSGLTVSFSSQTPSVCTVSGATVTLGVIGTCTIQATQAGNGNYSPAPLESQSFTVTAGIGTLGVNSLNFPNTIVGNTTAAQTFNFQNSGNTPLAITSIAPAGPDAANYHYAADASHPCPISPATLAVSASCTLDVTFAPVWQGAHNNAQIAIIDNSGNVSGTTQSIGLTGTGIVLASISVSANSASLTYGASEPFTATGTYSDNSTASLTSQVTWASSAQNVVSINANGLATALSAGQTNITAALSGVTSNNFQLTALPRTPASIAVSAGSGQSAMVGTAFAGYLQALAKDGGGDVVPNTPVTFTAPSSGASGTFANGFTTYTAASNSSGIASSSIFTANATAGNYSVTAGVSGVAATAAFSLTNTKAPSLTITESPVGTFIQGQSAVYTVTVANAANAGPTAGTITVTEVTTAGLTLTGLNGGSTWICSVATASCTTNTVLNPGSRSSITVTVTVANNAQGSVSNGVGVTGGASQPSTASDPTPIFSACAVTQGSSTTVADVQQLINEALGLAPPQHDLTTDGAVNVLDVQIVLEAALGAGCSTR
jgi:hypothetical protein